MEYKTHKYIAVSLLISYILFTIVNLIVNIYLYSPVPVVEGQAFLDRARDIAAQLNIGFLVSYLVILVIFPLLTILAITVRSKIFKGIMLLYALITIVSTLYVLLKAVASNTLSNYISAGFSILAIGYAGYILFKGMKTPAVTSQVGIPNTTTESEPTPLQPK